MNSGVPPPWENKCYTHTYWPENVLDLNLFWAFGRSQTALLYEEDYIQDPDSNNFIDHGGKLLYLVTTALLEKDRKQPPHPYKHYIYI